MPSCEFRNDRSDGQYLTERPTRAARLDGKMLIDITMTPPNTRFVLERAVTQAFQSSLDLTPEMREAHCLAAQFPLCFLPLQPDDLFAGRVKTLAAGVNLRRHGYFCDTDLLADAGADDVAGFWRDRSTVSRISAAMPDALHAAMAVGVSRRGGFTGAVPDYDTLLTHGIQSLTVRIDARRNISHAPRAAWDGMLQALRVLDKSIVTLAERARQDGHAQIATALGAIAEHPPRTLHEAMQLLLVYAAHAGFPEQFGRLDVALGDAYIEDLRAGRLTRERAAQLLAAMWRCFPDAARPLHVTVGGLGRRNPRNADAFAQVVVDAVERMGTDAPQLSMRVHPDADPELHARARVLRASGRAHLYDDAVFVPQLEHVFDVAMNMAERYVPTGPDLFALGSASFNAPLCELDLNGIIARSSAFDTQEARMSAAREGVERACNAAADYHALACDVTAVEAPGLFVSMLMDGCIARGEGMFTGGLRYLGGAVQVRGLEAMRSLVVDGGEPAYALAAQIAEHARAIAREQRERTWLHAYVCGWEG